MWTVGKAHPRENGKIDFGSKMRVATRVFIKKKEDLTRETVFEKDLKNNDSLPLEKV